MQWLREEIPAAKVTPWSMSDFKGSFNWIRDILEAPTSPFRDKVGMKKTQANK